MNFGRIDHLEGIRHAFPGHSRIASRLAAVEHSHSMHVRLGAPAWGDKGFVGKIYPEGARPSEYLKYYSRQFDAIELNSTFYRLPKKETVLGWLEKTPDEFRFCPKFPQAISYSRDLNAHRDITESFLEMLHSFGPKLGLAFLQLPQHFSIHRLHELESYLGQLPRDIHFAIEFRHSSWFDAYGLVSEVFQMLNKLGIGAVITDTSGRRDVLHLDMMDSCLMVRFTGNRLHSTDFQRLDDWIGQMRQWSGSQLQTIYYFMHQPEEHLCVDLAMYAAERLSGLDNIVCKSPTLVASPGKQASLFE